METIEKISVNILKNELKDLSTVQKILKNQRKTVNLVGERIKDPGIATYEHQRNREKLRIMYAAYGLMRGKSFSQTENKYPEEGHPLNEFKKQIDEIVLKYMIEEEQLSNLV
jgi:hypothetical protein